MKSATEFRSNFASADEDTQQKMLTDLFGKYDANIHELMKQKITEKLVKMDPKGPKNLKIVDKPTKYARRSIITKNKNDQYSRIRDAIEHSTKVNKLEQLETVVQIYPCHQAIGHVWLRHVRGVQGSAAST